MQEMPRAVRGFSAIFKETGIILFSVETQPHGGILVPRTQKLTGQSPVLRAQGYQRFVLLSLE